MKGKLIIITLLVVISIVLFNCKNQDNPVARYEWFRIDGKVVGGLFNAGAPGLKVMRGTDVMFTDNKGYFYFGGTSNDPVKDYFVTDTLNKTGSIFKDVNAGVCYLPHTVANIDPATLPQASVNVTLPGGLGSSNRWKVFFTYQDNINGIADDGYCTVYLPNGNTVYGRVSVLLYTVNNSNIVTSYDRFGFKEYVELIPGNTTNLIFTDSMLGYNPPEVQVAGTITNVPPNTNSYPSFFMMSLSPRNANYFYFDAMFFEISGNSFNFLIPGNLPVSFYPLLKLNYADSANLSVFTTKVSYLLPTSGNTNINIVIPSPVQIISPPPSSVIDSNTVFNLYTNYTNRIFHIQIENVSRVFHLYTKNNNFSLADLYKLGIGGLEHNTSLAIKINALGSYSSVSDFVCAYYKNVDGYSSPIVENSYIVKP